MKSELHSAKTIYSIHHVPSWLSLCAAAGGVNAFAFLTCQQFVTHVTGTVTRLGLEAPRYGIAAEYGAVVGSFIVGAAVSVVFIQARATRGKKPRWATPLITVAGLLIGVAVAGHLGVLGRYGVTLAADEPPVLLLSLLAFAMGLQNATVASTTGLAVRTTHATGPATDLGVSLGIACLIDGPERADAVKSAALRGGKITAFVTGAAGMIPLANTYSYLALIAPAILILVSAALSFTTRWSPNDVPFTQR